jgi:hypothetical protein
MLASPFPATPVLEKQLLGQKNDADLPCSLKIC